MNIIKLNLCPSKSWFGNTNHMVNWVWSGSGVNWSRFEFSPTLTKPDL